MAIRYNIENPYPNLLPPNFQSLSLFFFFFFFFFTSARSMATIPFKNVIFMMHNHLSLSTPTTHFSVSASASSSDSYPSYKAFTIDYLTTKCGLSLKSAITTSRKLHVDNGNIERSNAFLSLLKSHGFDKSHIAKIIHWFPPILNKYRVDENLKLKLEYLVENGFSGPDLHHLVVSSPRLLGTSLTKKIKPSIDYLRSLLGTEERLKLALRRNSELLKNNLKNTQQIVDLLLKEGVPLDSLRNFFALQLYLMVPKVDRLVSALQIGRDVMNMRPTDSSFLHVVLRIADLGVPRWEKKLQFFNSLGFSQQQAFFMFKCYPQCLLGISEEKLRSNLEFYLNTVKLKPDDVASRPGLLGLAIETRIRPRHNVLKVLWSKKLVKEDNKIVNIFVLSEDKFSRRFVTKHLQKVPSLLEMYNNDKAGVK